MFSHSPIFHFCAQGGNRAAAVLDCAKWSRPPTKLARDLLDFYLEAGVDALLGEEPSIASR